MIRIATERGLFELSRDRLATRLGGPVRGTEGRWAITSGEVIDLERGTRAGLGHEPWCVAARDGEALIGTAAAHLYRWDGDGDARADDGFDAIPTRDTWYTPWGGPPDTRSLAVGARTTLVNVHVGGVWRGGADGWTEVVEVDDDAHQVVIDGDQAAVAAAVGVRRSRDGGVTWDGPTRRGLHAGYCRAVAIAGDLLFVTASGGPSSRDGRVYRAPFQGDEPFEPCGGGLPESFPFNLDTYQLDASGDRVALGTTAGELWCSDDAGSTWERRATDLGRVHAVAVR